MIVVSRAVGTTIMIGEDVDVTVDAIGQHTVELRLTRRELHGRLTTETKHRLAVQEQLDLGGGCRCILVEMHQAKVRLGFEVPQTMPIHRKEVWDAIRRQMRGDT